MVFFCRGACAGFTIGGRGVSALRKVSHLEPAGGFEPPTFHLQGGCSTTELRRRSCPICSAFADATPHHTVPTPFTPPTRRKVLNPRIISPLPVVGSGSRFSRADSGALSRNHEVEAVYFSRFSSHAC